MSFIVGNDLVNYDPNALDAGGALSVSQKTILGNYVQDKDNLPLLLDRKGTGSQTYSAGVVSMSVTSGQYAVCQSFKRHLYLAGKSQELEITFNNFAPQANIIKRVGLFTSNTTAPYNSNLDGFFLESDGADIRIKIQKNGSSISDVIQSAWNIDPLDGTGPSGLTLNFNNFTVMKLDYLYLGGTALRVYFNIGGVFYLAHVEESSNINSSTFVNSPVLPVRWEIRSTTGTGSLGQICAAVTTGGALDLVGFPHSETTGTSFINANNTANTYLVCAIRLNNLSASVNSVVGDVLATTNDAYIAKFILNPTIAGAALTWNTITNTGAQFAIGDTANPSTNTVTGGTILSEAFGTGNATKTLLADSLFQIGADLDGVADILALCVQPIGSNLDIRGLLNFKHL